MDARSDEPTTFLVDARWLGIGGPGRVTEHLLTGLAELAPDGDWVLWGGDEVADLTWPTARRVPSRHHPHDWFSQREIPGPRSVRADVAYFPHQMRPAWHLAVAEVTTVHDTIPFRYPPSRRLGPPVRMYMRHMARMSDIVTTDSEFSRQSIVRDLGIRDDRIIVAPLPIDHAAAARVRRRRAESEVEPVALYLGADLPHKNLERLIAAFAQSRFQADGGRLALVGMDDRSLERLESVARRHAARIEPIGHLPQYALEQLLASASLLVQPSLEEGFGLPVAEAMAAGIPVAVSSGGALPEITRGSVPTFDPTSIDSIHRAIDDTVIAGAVESPSWSTPLDLARVAHGAMLRAYAIRRGGSRRGGAP